MVAHPVSNRNQNSAPLDFTSALFGRDGRPVDFSVLQAYEDLAAVLNDGFPSSYPESRHLVGISPKNPVQHANAAPVVRVFDRAAPLDLGDGQREEVEWRIERAQYESAQVLRSLLAEHDERLHEACGDEGKILQHSKSDRQRLTPYRCQVRSVCPCCGRAYGIEKGLEVASLLDAVLAPGRLVRSTPTVKTWALVLSCDEQLSAYVHDLVVDGRVEQLRKILRHLTEDVQATLKFVFGPGVAAVVAWHWWHSSNPLAGTHLHAHVTVPNVDVRLDADSGEWTPTMRALRGMGRLSPADLRSLREGFGERVMAHHWARRAGITSWNPNVHVRFTLRADGQGYRHRARYDARHPVSDLLRVVEPQEITTARNVSDADLTEQVFLEQLTVDIAELASSDNAEALSWWVHASSVWQGVQTIRYTGWLVNSARKRLGLLKTSSTDGEPEWASVGLYRLVSWAEDGVTVERFRNGQRLEEHWHRDHVDLMPPPSKAKGYEWNDSVRPELLTKAPPPLAWLSQSGLEDQKIKGGY